MSVDHIHNTSTSSEPGKDKDRAELERIISASDLEADLGFPSDPDYEAFVQALLRWKRGERFWCRHIPVNKYGVYEAQKHAGWPFIVEKVGDEVMFCPICGARRPE